MLWNVRPEFRCRGLEMSSRVQVFITANPVFSSVCVFVALLELVLSV